MEDEICYAISTDGVPAHLLLIAGFLCFVERGLTQLVLLLFPGHHLLKLAFHRRLHVRQIRWRSLRRRGGHRRLRSRGGGHHWGRNRNGSRLRLLRCSDLICGDR